MTRQSRRRRWTILLLALACIPAVAVPAMAQLDPLLSLRSSRPYVLIALDRSSRMQRDLSGDYRDPSVYHRTGAAWEAGLGVTEDNTAEQYRRVYSRLAWLDPGGSVRAEAEEVRVAGDRDPLFSGFDAATRLGIARAALARAVAQNAGSAAFGLVASRQSNAAFDADAPAHVRVTGLPPPSTSSDTEVAGEWGLSLATTEAPGSEVPPGPPLVSADDAGANARILQVLGRSPFEAEGVVAAGLDTPAADDAPLLHLLDDVRSEAARLAAADTSCRNIVVLLVAAGDQEPSMAPPLDRRALDFLRVAGRRVPVHVIALAPGTASARLAAVAAATGGRYTEIQPSDGIDAVAEALHAVVRAANTAVQHGLARFTDVAAPGADGSVPPGESEYSVAAPLVATVNLEGARGAAGQLLPGTRIAAPDGSVIPQPSNVTVTAGFALPGFAGRLRAFRVYRPETDAAAALGYRFVADGTRLWTATVPTADRRNLFTVVPGHGVVPLSGDNASLLAPYLAEGSVDSAASLIRFVRQLPLGAITHSTPALLTPPAGGASDPAYRAFLEANRDRRALVFVGADDGMLHAVDARTGLEAWAAIPFNLLPKLRLLLDGQPLDAYPFFVGGSPRLADVRTAGGWKTLLVVGEGPGGTFYQAFDVTLPGMGQALGAGGDSADVLLGYFSDASRIPFLWSFPSYARFDAALPPFGDVAAGASEAEKSVGESWSTPSILQIPPTGPSVVLVGSGSLAASAERRENRNRTAAGRTLYLLDADGGALLDSNRLEADGLGEDQDACPPGGCTAFKNALAADPAVLLGAGSPSVQAYMGDLDGHLWQYGIRQRIEGVRFSGAPRLVYQGRAGEPIFAAAALARPGFDRTFVFVATGSDLAFSAPGAPAGRLLALVDGPSGAVVRGEIVLGGAGAGVERASSVPALAGEVVFFTSTYPGGTACDPGTGRLYALTFGWGAAYDWTGDGRKDGADAALLRAPGPGRVSAPTAADRHVLVAAGDRLEVFGDPRGYNQGPGFTGVRILSWREVH